MQLTLILVLAFLVINVLIDFYLINKSVNINHTKHAVVAMIAYIALLVTMVLIKQIEPSEAFAVAVMLPAVRWLLHDFGLNLLRKKPLGYVGESANSDKLIKYLNDKGVPTWFIKLLAIGLSGVAASIGIEYLF